MRTEWKGKKHRLDLVMDMTKPWPHRDNSVDGIVGMHVFQQIDWRGLVVAFKEAYRVLKEGGVLRIGCPMVEIEDRPLEYLLGWMNINLFSADLLKRVLVKRIGFRHFRQRGFGRSRIPELAKIDNRPGRGTLYYEVIK
jgi:ubiquinone/menaquinone biosynthesis C-methylase UbiE